MYNVYLRTLHQFYDSTLLISYLVLKYLLLSFLNKKGKRYNKHLRKSNTIRKGI